MKSKITLTLALIFLCAGASTLLANDTDKDNPGLQAAFPQFPLLNLVTNDLEDPIFQALPLTNAVVVNGTKYYGFRFQVPKREHHEDLVWAFVQPGQDFFHWYILPQSGEMPGFADFEQLPTSDYLGTDELFPLNAKNLILQRLSGDTLRDGETYLIWFSFQDRHPNKLSLTFAFSNVERDDTNQIKAIEKVLALDRPSSHRIVNPNNHHTYILLRQSKWIDAEAEAVALGGHLATVRNQAEEDWIFKTFGSYGGTQRLLWIGLSDTAKKFHFGWSSGESVSYTCWAPGEPNNSGNGEDFVAIFYPNHDQGGKWNDWEDRNADPIGLPMNGVAEIVPKEKEGSAPPANTTLAQDLAGKLTAVDIRPSLIITNDSGSIKLQWPIAVSDFMLEATTNLDQSFAMFGYSELTNSETGMVYVIITNPAPQMFFRLRKP